MILSKNKVSSTINPRWSNGHDFRLSIPIGNKRGRPGFDSQSGRFLFVFTFVLSFCPCRSSFYPRCDFYESK
ncbi:uncharacterized protein BO80DRAFT_259852 [Aspergillus ibericus CBS 121593]|uniref:Uncharacterized protein n=1 Tax=Aspergillus ibericus CBS 121593 TaxID=1448316 RepID=A0A395GJH4_9EURO|nr:hypothetical protein BO80DRAFT_259852 [Aspergillus ibericus CBS 121593]RAK95640.1 hypothetical protein BO80DRAFT_259852 [Aspergillus ibericus CBS 121593]